MWCDPACVNRTKFGWRLRTKVEDAIPQQQVRESYIRWNGSQFIQLIDFEAISWKGLNLKVYKENLNSCLTWNLRWILWSPRYSTPTFPWMYPRSATYCSQCFRHRYFFQCRLHCSFVARFHCQMREFLGSVFSVWSPMPRKLRGICLIYFPMQKRSNLWAKTSDQLFVTEECSWSLSIRWMGTACQRSIPDVLTRSLKKNRISQKQLKSLKRGHRF